MARGTSREDKIKAGAFLLGSLVLALVIVLLLSGLGDMFASRSSYIVRFELDEGAEGLEAGSPVQLGGRDVGKVSRVRVRYGDGEQPRIDAHIAVDSDLVFYGEPVAYLHRPLLGSGATLNFRSVGQPGEAPAAPGAVFSGEIAAPALLEQAGYGDEQRRQVQEILARAESLAVRIDEVAADIQRVMAPDLKQVVRTARERVGPWFDQGDAILSNVRAASERAVPIADSIEVRLAQLDALFSEAQAVIEENRPNVLATTQNSREGTANWNAFVTDLREKAGPLIEGIMTEAHRTTENVARITARADALLAEQAPSIRRAIANARIAADELKLTLAEVRRSPWRLLYRPAARELEFELLYDSARTYAAAVGDLRAASESLEAASARAEAPDAGEVEQSEVCALVEEVGGALDRYRQAEQAFLDLVIERQQH